MIIIQEIGKFYFVNLVCWDRGSLMSKLVLFGSVLEERCCTESCYDDTIRVPSEADLTGICGVMKGVVLYAVIFGL